MPLLLTLSSGVKGFTTIHAGSARQALTRLRFICLMSNAADLPLSARNSLVSESIDIVVILDATATKAELRDVEQLLAKVRQAF